MRVTADAALETAQSEAQSHILTVTGACIDTKKSQLEHTIIANSMNARRRFSVNGHPLEIDEVPWPETRDCISEFHRIGHWRRGFPGIFHTGYGDPTDESHRVAGKVAFSTATRHVAMQACAREHTPPITDGEIKFEFEYQMLAATDKMWCYAAKDELDRKNITRARNMFISKRGDMAHIQSLSGIEFLHKLKDDPTLMADMTRSTGAVRASKAAYSRDLLRLKNWLAYMMFTHPRRDTPTIFHTITLPGYNDYNLYRIQLVCDGTWERYKLASATDKMKMRVNAFHRHPNVQVQFFELWKQQMLTLADYIYGDLHESAGTEFQRSGNGHAHLLRFVKGAPNMRGVTEEAFSDDVISIDRLNAWYTSQNAIAAYTRKQVERKYESNNKRKSFTAWAREELFLSETDDNGEATCRFLFVVMSVERMCAQLSSIEGEDIEYLRSRVHLSSDMDPSDIQKSDDEFLCSFSIFEEDEILISAQKKAHNENRTVSSVRLEFLRGKEISYLGKTTQRPQPYRGLDTEKAVSSRIIEEFRSCLEANESDGELKGIVRWNEEYLYCMIFHDAMTDAWSPLRDDQGRVIEGLQSWAGFVENEISAGRVKATEEWKWRMTTESTNAKKPNVDGILLSTTEMREAFIEKYGFELFFGLVQQHTQRHECSKDYCCAPKRIKQTDQNGKVSTTPTRKNTPHENIQYNSPYCLHHRHMLATHHPSYPTQTKKVSPHTHTNKHTHTHK
jgi:hypothetical protein